MRESRRCEGLLCLILGTLSTRSAPAQHVVLTTSMLNDLDSWLSLVSRHSPGSACGGVMPGLQRVRLMFRISASRQDFRKQYMTPVLDFIKLTTKTTGVTAAYPQKCTKEDWITKSEVNLQVLFLESPHRYRKIMNLQMKTCPWKWSTQSYRERYKIRTVFNSLSITLSRRMEEQSYNLQLT